MALPPPASGQTNDFYPDLAAIHRPFGSSAVASNIPVRLRPDLERGQPTTSADLRWTHVLDVGATVDIRDGCTRTAGSNAITFADGDEVRIATTVGTTRYVVVWVEELPRPGGVALKRAYLLRHTPPW